MPKHSMIVISAAAFLVSSAALVLAQTPPETPPADAPTVTRDVDRDDDFDWGWLGLLGLLGLGGLAGRRDREVVTTRRV
jgi:MYXO-CTERM domain-containing protein